MLWADMSGRRSTTSHVDVDRLRLLFRRAQAKKSPPLILKYGLKLGKRLRKEKQHEEATDVLSATLLNQMDNVGEDHADTALVLVALGDVFEAKGNYARAVTYFNKALPIQEAQLGKDHDTTTKTALKLASIQSHQEEYYDKALEAYREALQIKLDNVGELHPSTAVTLINLGLVCKQQGDMPRALEYLTHALTIRSRVFGTTHVETAACITHLADLYRVEGSYDKALEYYKWSLSIQEAHERPRHRAIADCLYNIALIHKHLRAYSDSQQAFTQAAQHFTIALGADDAETLDCVAQAERARTLAGRETPQHLSQADNEAETAI
ncbi:hypothetical protein PTSG_02405 [Salpingoeca rosetta]|uniref:Uncharacterized protein n=1 Tax=Salpingoeca rosetta (strain ATCC 50818 / BSB-021) TaxID=946362 RepID=F2U240_SALR5|nr:uncharacterized protein PTSG_02405 [Salpingoeca rosetta]EGD81692.1 hypothetical protein PTSG_02405 [Salpingoeca rosetta]|eukprot:XP_004996896.1 hypothetical protein PTSG_02405 [Salpingoeca rosetta]